MDQCGNSGTEEVVEERIDRCDDEDDLCWNGEQTLRLEVPPNSV
jgi:hypothetical protein